MASINKRLTTEHTEYTEKEDRHSGAGQNPVALDAGWAVDAGSSPA